MVYNPHPPYEILQNKLINFETMQRMRRFARYWDLVGNSGNFVETCPLLWSGRERGPFAAFMRFSDWLHGVVGRTDSIALTRLLELLFQFLTQEINIKPESVALSLWRDYQRGGRRDTPICLRNYLPEEAQIARSGPHAELPRRQARHVAAFGRGPAEKIEVLAHETGAHDSLADQQ